MARVDDTIKMAKAEIGVTEAPPNSNNVKYNTWYYGHEVSGSSYPWCCVFIEWLFRLESGFIKKTASCTTLKNDMKAKGLYTPATDPNFKKLIQPGDLVFFNFDKTPDPNTAKHIGICVDVTTTGVKTIEGNTSADNKGCQDNGGMVALRTRNFGKTIIGFARPQYSDAKPTPSPEKTTRPTIRFGSKGEDVLYLHKRLRVYNYGVSADSDYFDVLTKVCVINFQASHNLQPDGVVGPKTWEALG